MDTVLEGVVDELIRDNEEVRSTFDALCERGKNPQDVKEELARVFMGVRTWLCSRSSRSM